MQIPLTLEDLADPAPRASERAPATRQTAQEERDLFDALLLRIQSIVRRPSASAPLSPDDTQPARLAGSAGRS